MPVWLEESITDKGVYSRSDVFWEIWGLETTLRAATQVRQWVLRFSECSCLNMQLVCLELVVLSLLLFCSPGYDDTWSAARVPNLQSLLGWFRREASVQSFATQVSVGVLL